jgi:hypothetical protein
MWMTKSFGLIKPYYWFVVYSIWPDISKFTLWIYYQCCYHGESEWFRLWCRSRSYFTTDSQSINMSWYWARTKFKLSNYWEHFSFTDNSCFLKRCNWSEWNKLMCSTNWQRKTTMIFKTKSVHTQWKVVHLLEVKVTSQLYCMSGKKIAFACLLEERLR